VSEFFKLHNRFLQVDVSAPNPLMHRSWFGWVESRIRTLVISIEQPPFLYCSPTSSCFHRRIKFEQQDVDAGGEGEVKGGDGGAGGEGEGERKSEDKKEEGYISSFFFGLVFLCPPGTANPDVTVPVTDFIQKVNSWPSKHEQMRMRISIIDQTQIPSFVNDTMPEPSSLRGCTPAKTKPSLSPMPSSSKRGGDGGGSARGGSVWGEERKAKEARRLDQGVVEEEEEEDDGGGLQDEGEGEGNIAPGNLISRFEAAASGFVVAVPSSSSSSSVSETLSVAADAKDKEVEGNGEGVQRTSPAAAGVSTTSSAVASQTKKGNPRASWADIVSKK